MVILKKIQGATLVETLVASIIILIAFSIASLSLNNIFGSTVRKNDGQYQNRVKEVIYFASHKKLGLPFYENNNTWDISVELNGGVLLLDGTYKPSRKTKLDTIRLAP